MAYNTYEHKLTVLRGDSTHELRETLPAASGSTIVNGMIVHRTADNQWAAGVTTIAQRPFVVIDDGKDGGYGSTVRDAAINITAYGTNKGIAAIPLNAGLKFATSEFTGTTSTLTPGVVLSAPLGTLKVGVSTEIIVATVDEGIVADATGRSELYFSGNWAGRAI